MRLFSVLLPLATLFGFVSLAAAQVAAIRTALTDIKSDVTAFKNAFTAGNATTIRTTGEDLYDAITSATTVVEASPAIGFFDAVGLASDISSLQTAVDDAFSVVTAKKSVVDGLGIRADVLQLLVEQRAAVAVLGGKVVAKVPSILQGTAKSYVSNLDSSFAKVIGVYSS